MAYEWPEQTIHYPVSWEEEYKRTGFVQQWRDEYPEQFQYYKGSDKLGSRTMFPQYCLMYVLRVESGIESLTWYNLAINLTERTRKRDRILRHWSTMKQWMGEHAFSILQDAIRASGLSGFAGEPDLFCWKPDSGEWFFAEAKGKGDHLQDSQEQWAQICKQVLPQADIRLYNVLSRTEDT